MSGFMEVPGEGEPKTQRRKSPRKSWPTAFLVAYLRPDGTYKLGVFSERCPTTTRDFGITACLAEGYGKDFVEGREDIRRWIKDYLPVETVKAGGDEWVRQAKEST